MHAHALSIHLLSTRAQRWLLAHTHPPTSQGRWNRYEEDLAAANATEKALSMEQGKASKQQIFSRCGSAMLLLVVVFFYRARVLHVVS